MVERKKPGLAKARKAVSIYSATFPDLTDASLTVRMGQALITPHILEIPHSIYLIMLSSTLNHASRSTGSYLLYERAVCMLVWSVPNGTSRKSFSPSQANPTFFIHGTA